MIGSFGDEAIEDVYHGADTRPARQLPMRLWRPIVRKLDQIAFAVKLQDLAVPPGNRLEALKGDQAGRYSIRVNDQYRITFRWEGDSAYQIVCEDYH